MEESKGVVLKLRGLLKRFREADGNLLEVTNVRQFELGAGEQAVLVGQSGSGKSTLLNLIAGILCRMKARSWSMARTPPSSVRLRVIDFVPPTSATYFSRSICCKVSLHWKTYYLDSYLAAVVAARTAQSSY